MPDRSPNGEQTFDLAVIGAGINGAGIARDAAMRGLRVVVLEQNDLCSATSAISSRLIHGGLRYLEYGEIPLVFESLHERRALRQNAPHLVKPLRICIPVYATAKRGPLLVRLGMLAYDLLSFGKRMPGHEMLSRDQMLAIEPGLRADGLRGAARYFDAQVTFAERLVLENLLSARSAGASVRTYSQVTRIGIEDGTVTSIEYLNTLTGEEQRISVRAVVNAAGPWVDAVIGTAAKNVPKFIGGTKGSHIIVGRFPGAPSDAFYVEAAADGRPFFVIPWNEQYLIGTTDIRFDGDLSNVRASSEEIDYLLNETNRVFPQANLRLADIHYAYAGVRPLPRRKKGPESAITRKHIIKKNRRIAKGLISIIGGKLTTYRSLAEQTVDCVAKVLARKLPPCASKDTPLPGTSGVDAARAALLSFTKLSERGVERLLAIYGGRARDIAELTNVLPDGDRCIDAQSTLLAAEVVFSIREEFAQTLTDIVHRRMMIGLSATMGREFYDDVAIIAAREFAWDDATRLQQLAALVSYSDSLKVN